MAEEPLMTSPAPTDQHQADPIQIKWALERMRSEQNLPGGLIAGAVAAAIGASVWAVVTFTTGYQIGWMAVGIGFLVGFALRKIGKGVDKIFGISGAVLALLGCAAGNLLTVYGMLAKQENVSLVTLLSRLDFAIIHELMTATFSPMDLLFYGIAVYEGYKLSFRQLTQGELANLLPGQ